MKITENERAVLLGITQSDYAGGVTGLDLIDYPVWSWSGRPDGMTPRSYAGVCGSLARKGLVTCDSDPCNAGSGADDTIALTALGYAELVTT